MGSSNPINDMLQQMDSQQQKQPTAPANFSSAPVAPSAAGSNQNPVDSMLKQFDSGAATPGPVAVAATPKMPEAPNPITANPIDSVLKSFDTRNTAALSLDERLQSSRPDPENQTDEPWYSKTWDWMNKPLYDAHQWGVREGAGNIERGFESGVEDLISGLTSPLSLALTVGTLGGGATLGAASTGLRAIGVAAEDAPIVARGIKVLMDAGFTGQAIQGVVTQFPQALDALKDGDYETATRLATSLTATGALAALGARHGFEDAKAVKEYMSGGDTPKARETMAVAKKIAGILDQDRVVASQKAKEFAASIHEQLEATGSLDEVTQGAIRKFMVAGGDLALLKSQHDTLAGILVPKSETTENLPTWKKDYLFHASDVKNADMIRNAGVKGPKQKVAWYANSPEEAIRSGVTPVSGNRADLRVFAVPRAEVEESLSKTGFQPDKADIGAGRKDFTATNQTHMPSHEIVLDEKGVPTGHVVPLRVDANIDPFGLTRDRSRFESEYTADEKAQLLAMYKKAANLTPEQQALAESLRDHYENQFNKAASHGIIRSAVENYHPQAWAKDNPTVLESVFGIKHEQTDNVAYNQLRHQTDNGAFDTNVAAAKQRAFETEFQGEMAGYKAKSNDLSYHAADYQMKLDRAIAAREFLENMRKSGARAGDGRPLVALAGSSKIVGEDSGNPALLVNPQTVRSVNISQDIIKKLQEVDQQSGVSKLQTLVENGTIERLPWTREVIDEESGEPIRVAQFAWSTDGYQTVDHPSMRGWRHIGQDTAGNNAIMHAQMRIHPEAAEYVRQVVGADVSKLRSNPYMRGLMAAQREAKGALLSFSPFHAVQEGLRGLMLGINPFDWKPVDVANDPVLRLGVRNNLTFPDYKAEDMFSDGSVSHSKIIGKIPGLNKVQDYIQEFTFNKLIPSLKARGFKSVFSRFQEKMPGSSSDEVARAAATYVNDVFGGQHWRDLGVSASSQDMMRAVALAPDWLTSEIRTLWRAAGGMGKPAASIARTDMMRLTAGVYMTARVINMLTTGKPHPEAPFGLVVAGNKGEDDKVYSLRTLPTDLVHVLSDPRGFAMGRVNPLIVRTAIEGLTGRDQFGRKVTGQQEFKDFYTNFVPIGGQALLKGNTGGLTTKDQAIKALGATVYKYRTEAEKLAQEKASDHMPSGPVDPDQLAAHQRNIRLEDGLRNGEVSKGEIRRMLPTREADLVIKQSGMSPLQARFQRLPLKDALSVWEITTPSERDDLHKLLWDKRVAYIQSHTGSQRSADPTWIKLQKVMADLHGR